MRTPLRLARSCSRLLLYYLQFIMSLIMAVVNVGRIEAVQMQWLPLVKSLAYILIFLITFVVSDVVMVIALYI